jgi:vitamin K-dependent gamma-carboxylase
MRRRSSIGRHQVTSRPAASWIARCCAGLAGMVARGRSALGEPIDGASLALFRICFGLVSTWEAVLFLWPHEGGSRAHRLFVAPSWNFPYHGFEWVRPLPEPFMTLSLVVYGLAGFCVALGLCYRTAAVALVLSTTYLFLLESSTYLNHFYLMCLLAFLLAVMPAGKCWSLEAWLRSRSRQREGNGAGTVPFWPVFLLRTQLFIVYCFGGIAKLDSDWLTGAVMERTARRASDWFVAMPYLDRVTSLASAGQAQVAWLLAVGGLAFDLAIGFLLTCRRTRFLALVLCAMFHGFNSQAFNIGVFPLLALTGTLIFCEPDWPRRAWHWVRRPRVPRPDWAWLAAGVVAVPLVGALAGWKAGRAARMTPHWHKAGRLTFAFLTVWIVVQFALPLRHYAIEGDAKWTDEGHRFSWRMMLRKKSGVLQFVVFDPEMLVTYATGAVEVDWAELAPHRPPVLHQDIDGCQVDWSLLPELAVIFEPLVGERIVYNHRASERGAITDVAAWLDQEWLATYGHRPQVRQTVPLQAALEAIHHRSTKDVAPEASEGRTKFVSRLALARQMDAAEPVSPADRERWTIELGNILEGLLADETHGALVREELGRTHPFMLQGGRHVGLPFLVVEDPELQVLTPERRVQLDRRQWKHTHVVYFDPTRTGIPGWKSLPQIIIDYQDGEPRLTWNYHRDLTPRQIDRMTARPFMAHQYARRIAQLWEQQYGRRPRVYAATSLVALNNRSPQKVIDPAVDLATAPIELFGHNDWILPLEPGPPAGSTKNRSEERTTWRNGELHSTTTVWTEEGRLLMQVARVNGLRHGLATRWHRNGQLAMQVQYRFDRPHGPATMWYENGLKSWEGEFCDGQRQGLATGWYGDGRVAEQAQFERGALVRYLGERKGASKSR